MAKRRTEEYFSYSVMSVKLDADSGQRTIKKKHWCFFEKDYKSHRSKDCPVITPVKRCWHCNLPGHIARFCRIENIYKHEKAMKRPREYYCRNESKWGKHRTKDCPKVEKEKQKKLTVTKGNNNRFFCQFERRWGEHQSRHCPKQFPKRNGKIVNEKERNPSRRLKSPRSPEAAL